MASSRGKSRAQTRGPAGGSRTPTTRPDSGREGKSSEHKRLGTVSFVRVRITPPAGAALPRRLPYEAQKIMGRRASAHGWRARGAREMPVQELERHTRLTRAGISHPCPDQ